MIQTAASPQRRKAHTLQKKAQRPDSILAFQITQRPVITHSKDAAPEDTSDHLLPTKIQTPKTHLFLNYYTLAFEQVLFILRSKVKECGF